MRGTFEVPCYLEPDCDRVRRFALGPDGPAGPERHLHREVQLRDPARCAAPRPGGRSCTDTACSASADEATSGDQQILGQTHNFVICATDAIGFSTEDVPNIVTNVLPDLGNFPELDRPRPAGDLNELFLGRLMIHADGFRRATRRSTSTRATRRAPA